MSRAIHQNLDTAFVNVNALMRYLCRRGFVGQIHVEMSAYEADMYLCGDNHVEVIEKDHVTGRVADGEEALQRLLVRAGEPGGIINVIQKDPLQTDLDPSYQALKPEPQIPVVEAKVPQEIQGFPQEIEVEGSALSVSPDVGIPGMSQLTQGATVATLSQQLNDEEWISLLKLTVELLASVDRTLGASGLEFQAAFAMAAFELSDDYDFLRTIEYTGGRLTVNSRPSPSIFISGVMEVMRKIMNRLGSNPTFTEVHHNAVEKLVDIVHRNKEVLDRYQVTGLLYRVLGVTSYAVT